MEKYKIQKHLGTGAFASVHKAINVETNEIVAIKTLKKKYQTWEECLVLREIKSLSKLKHPNIIKLIEVIHFESELHCVFEFLPQNLYEFYLSNKTITEPQIKSIMFQLTQGLSYMHKYGFFHRDLKPENLLMDTNNLKICDFGLAREIRSRPPFTDYVATRWYRAPEIILKSQNYNSPVDIWALGCIFAELYLIAPLFPGCSEVDQLNKICVFLGSPLESWKDGSLLAGKMNFQFGNKSGIFDVPSMSPRALNLLREILKWDPNKRLSAYGILQHEFFNDELYKNVTFNVHEKDGDGKRLKNNEEQNDNFSIPNDDRKNHINSFHKYSGDPPKPTPSLLENKSAMINMNMQRKTINNLMHNYSTLNMNNSKFHHNHKNLDNFFSNTPSPSEKTQFASKNINDHPFISEGDNSISPDKKFQQKEKEPNFSGFFNESNSYKDDNKSNIGKKQFHDEKSHKHEENKTFPKKHNSNFNNPFIMQFEEDSNDQIYKNFDITNHPRLRTRTEDHKKIQEKNYMDLDFINDLSEFNIKEFPTKADIKKNENKDNNNKIYELSNSSNASSPKNTNSKKINYNSGKDILDLEIEKQKKINKPPIDFFNDISSMNDGRLDRIDYFNKK